MDPNDYKYHVYFDDIIIAKNTEKQFKGNTVAFWNKGTQAVTINSNNELLPGQSYTYECYTGEINMQNYVIFFANDRAAGCKLLVTVKTYK